jgi:uncharacterized protein YdaU (DUF1376 family)
MAKAPVMPLFTDALIGDTTHLSAEQFGAYVLILIATWRNNGKALPDDDARMSKICKIGVTKWRRKVRPILREFFEVNESGWHQQRLEKEWDRIDQMLQARQVAGARGGHATQARRKTTGFAGATHNHKEEESFLSVGEVAARALAIPDGQTRARHRNSNKGPLRQAIEAMRDAVPPLPRANGHVREGWHNG